MTPQLARAPQPVDADGPAADDESIVIRNHDGAATHAVTIRLVDAHDGHVAYERTTRLSPLSVVSYNVPIDRAVYRVEVRLADTVASAECLIGDGPDEAALVEVGNGLVSVVEGVV
jgi:hypothetical protein